MCSILNVAVELQLRENLLSLSHWRAGQCLIVVLIDGGIKVKLKHEQINKISERSIAHNIYHSTISLKPRQVSTVYLLFSPLVF